jgi:beta-lactamase regulating signal transducer with metallopeptidase domain
MNSVAMERLWELGVDMALKSGLLSLAALVCVLLLRRAAAASRALCWALLFGALLALPLLASVLPRYQWNWSLDAVQRYRAPLSSRPAPAPRVEADPIPALPVPERFALIAPIQKAYRKSALRMPPIASTEIKPFARISTRSGPGRAEYGRVIKGSLLALWLIGGVVVLLRVGAGLIGTVGLWRQSRRVTEAGLQQLMVESRRELGVRREVLLLQTPAEFPARVPMTWGLWRPTILLPAYLLDWPQERLRTILLHEMAHIRRCDWPVQVLAQITLALYWFHPLLWWAASRLREESEWACDDRVLLAGVAPTSYAATLLEIIQTMKPSYSFRAATLCIARPPFEARLRAILAPHPRHTRSTRSLALSASVLACAGVLALASIHVGNAMPSAPHPPSSLLPVLTPLAHSPLGMEPAQANDPKKQHKPTSRPRHLPANKAVQQLQAKIATLELQLARHEAENAMLRAQLLMLQQRLASSTHPDSARDAATKQALQQARKLNQQEAANQAQRASLSAQLSELQAQRTQSLAELQRLEALFKAGFVSSSDVNAGQAKVKENEASIQSVEAQLHALEAGHTITSQVQERNELQLRLVILQVELLQKQQSFQDTQAKFQAGAIGKEELDAAQQKIVKLQMEIVDVQQRLATILAE